MNGVWLGAILPPVNWSGLSGLRPLHHHGLPTSLPSRPPQGWPWSPDNAVTTKAGKAVNSFPTGLGHCTRPPDCLPRSRPPPQAPGSFRTPRSPGLSLPPKASVLTLEEGGEKVGVGGATPGEGLPYLTSTPGPQLQTPPQDCPRSGWSRSPVPDPPLAHQVGKLRPGTGSRSLRDCGMLSLTSPLIVDLGDEGHPVPQRGQGLARLTQANEAKRRSSSIDRIGGQEPAFLPFLGGGGWRKNKGENWVPRGSS